MSRNNDNDSIRNNVLSKEITTTSYLLPGYNNIGMQITAQGVKPYCIGLSLRKEVC
ncbi:MAG: hypothetical protein WCE99_01860 [Nitrososphaeraceae archaeon]